MVTRDSKGGNIQTSHSHTMTKINHAKYAVSDDTTTGEGENEQQKSTTTTATTITAMLFTYLHRQRKGKSRLFRASISKKSIYCFLWISFLCWATYDLSLPDDDGNYEHMHSSSTPRRRTSWCHIEPGAVDATWDYYPHRPKQIVKEPEIHLDPQKCSSRMLLPLDMDAVIRPPSSGACDGYDGVLHIAHGDYGGASGTIFFQYVLSMLLWADQHNYIPWVHLNGYSEKVYDNNVHGQGNGVRFTMMDGMKIGEAKDIEDFQNCTFPGRPQLINTSLGLRSKEFTFAGTGVWQHYFEPVSPFQPGDPSCQKKPLVTMTRNQVTRELHSQATWTPHAWRYDMPYMVKRPDLPLRDWLLRQRLPAMQTRKRYIRFTPAMEQMAACAHPRPKNSLGLHIRHTDKQTSVRKTIPVRRFMRYAEAFVHLGGGDIYIATDSALVMEEIERTWSGTIRAHIVQQPGVEGRSHDSTAAFDLGVSAHQTNVEALTDMLALSKCTYLLHGLSAMTEAAFTLNPGLLERSLNMEDDEVEHTVDEFVTTILPRGRHIL